MLFADDLSAASAATASSNDAAFTDLFRRHRDGVFRFAWVLCGSGHVAEEITAEVFARVLPRWRLGGISDPLPYLRRAVLNEVRSRHRRRAHEQRAAAREIAAEQRVAEDVDRLELREPLLEALQRLPVRQRAVVVLRFHDDMSEAEVARIVGSPVGTVKAQTSRGLRTLRTILEEE